MYQYNSKTLEDLFEHMCLDMQNLCLNGITLSDGKKAYISILGCKGDWPFLVLRLQFMTPCKYKGRRILQAQTPNKVGRVSKPFR